MPDFTVRFGSKDLPLSLPDRLRVDTIAPLEVPDAPDPLRLVEEALDSLLGNIRLEDFRGSQSAAVAINDKTRPVPHDLLLPPLLERLSQIGIPESKITFVIATGTHTPMLADEFSSVVPERLLGRVNVVSHNCDADDLVNLGASEAGTPILANRAFQESDLRIVVGNIEPHHFMGFSGGAKTAAIGLAGRSTINANHAMLTHPDARAGQYENNPLRRDVEDIGQKMGVHLALNAILNNDKEIVRVFAGTPRAVMEAGVPFARSLCQVSIDEPYDLVIVSPGGYPKDINLYQSQKALTHAAMITRDGGTALLVAECIDGVGSEGLEHFMDGVTTLEGIFEKFRSQPFEMGPHKAFFFARDASRVNVLLYSSIDEGRVRRLLLTPVNNLQETLDRLAGNLPDRARVAIMPIGTITIPLLKISAS